MTVQRPTVSVFNKNVPHTEIYDGPEKIITQYDGSTYTLSKYVRTRFGVGMYKPEARLSIISQRMARPLFKVHYNEKKDNYLLIDRDNDDKFLFRPNANGLYQLCDVSNIHTTEDIERISEDILQQVALEQTENTRMVSKLHRVLAKMQ